MRPFTPILFLLAGLPLAAASAQTVSIGFDHLPGPDGLMGTADDLPIVAEAFYADTNWQLTDEYASVGVLFLPNPPLNDANEVLLISTFATPPTITAPNLLGNRANDVVEGVFTVPVSRVSALIGISSSINELEIFDANGNSLGSGIGDDVEVSLSSSTPIARFTVITTNSTFVAMDNLEFDVEGVGTAFCDPAQPNSTGQSTSLSGSMNSGVGSGLHLEVSQGPPNQFGYFLLGTAQNDPGVMVSQGRLCVAGAVGRFNVIGSVRNSTGQFDSAGIFQNFVGTATSTGGTGFDVPTGMPITGTPSITPGSTWTFQLWHREAGGQANFSNGLEVTF